MPGYSVGHRRGFRNNDGDGGSVAPGRVLVRFGISRTQMPMAAQAMLLGRTSGWGWKTACILKRCPQATLNWSRRPSASSVIWEDRCDADQLREIGYRLKTYSLKEMRRSRNQSPAQELSSSLRIQA